MFIRRPRRLTSLVGCWQVRVEKGLVGFSELRNISCRHREGLFGNAATVLYSLCLSLCLCFYTLC